MRTPNIWSVGWLIFLSVSLAFGRAESPEAQPMLVPQMGHGGFIESVSMTYDQQFFVTGGWDGTVRLWHAELGLELAPVMQKLGEGSTAVTAAQCSPVANKIAILAGGSSERLYLYNLDSRQMLWTNSVFYPNRGTLNFSADGRRLLIASGSAQESSAHAALHVIDVESGNTYRTIALPDAGKAGKPAQAERPLPPGTPRAPFVVRRPISVLSSDSKAVATGFDGAIDQALPVSVWDVETQALITRLDGPEQGLRTLCFWENREKLIGIGMDGALYVWNWAANTVPQRIEPENKNISFLSALPLPDGRRAVVAEWFEDQQFSGRGYFLRIIDLTSGATSKRFPHGQMYPEPIMAFTPDKTRLLSVLDKYSVQSFDTTNWNATLHLQSFGSGGAEAMQISRDETRALVRYRGEPYNPFALVLDLQTGQKLAHLTNGTAVAMSPDGLLVADDQRLINLSSGTATNWGRPLQPIHFSMDGKYLWTKSWSTGGRRIELVEIPSGAVKSSLTNLPIDISDSSALAGSADAQFIASAGILHEPDGAYDMTVRIRRMSTGEMVRRLQHKDGWVNSLQFSKDGQRLLICGQKASIWDLGTGERTLLFEDSEYLHLTAKAQFSADEKYVVTAHHGGVSAIWDAETAKRKATFAPHKGSCEGAVFGPVTGLLISGGRDGTLNFYRSGSTNAALSYYFFKDQSWAIADSMGRFDASSLDNANLYWAVGKEPIALRQLKSRYFDPGLFQKHFGRGPANKQPKDVAEFNAPRLYPKIVVEASDSGEIRIKAENQGGGIGRIAVKVNGKELISDARPAGADASTSELALRVSLRGDPRLKPGTRNDIEVIASNEEGYLQSRGKKVQLEPVGTRQADSDRRVWAVVVGVSRYREEAMSLRYSAKDALDFASALRIASGRLFGTSNVVLSVLASQSLSTPTVPGVASPTKPNIVAALSALSTNTGPEDIVIAYFSGHGVDRTGAENDFYFLTADAENLDLDDPEVRRKVAISSRELAEFLLRTRTSRQIVILDTCGAGKALDRLSSKREVSPDRRKALEDVKDKTGVFILAGCAADRPSYEASRFAQGILTYSLLMGMKRESPYVDVMDLFLFAEKRVPDLAKGIGGIQRPQYAARQGASFPFGIVTAEDRPKIPLHPALPIVLSAEMSDEDWQDALDLSHLFNEKMRELTALPNAELIFIDDRAFPDAYQLKARYRSNDGQIALSARLFQNGILLDKFDINQPRGASDVSTLADLMIREIQRRIRQLILTDTSKMGI